MIFIKSGPNYNKLIVNIYKIDKSIIKCIIKRKNETRINYINFYKKS